MKEFHKHIQIFKENFLSHKFPQTRRSSRQESIKLTDPFSKKNLPELKLIKLKTRPGSDPESEPKEKPKMANKTGIKYAPFIANINKHYKNNELMFPKIKNAINKTNMNFFEQKENVNNIGININIQQNSNKNKFASKRKFIQSKRNEKIKTLYGTYGISAKNMINNIKTHSIPNKSNDIEKSNNENIININNNNSNNNSNMLMINIHKAKIKNVKYSKNKSLPSKCTKTKKIKRELNFKENMAVKPLILNNNLINNNINNHNLDNNADIFTDNNKINVIDLKLKNNTSDNNSNINFPNYLEKKTNILDSFKPTPTSLPTTNSFLETDILQRINIINSLLNPLSIFAGLNSEKTVELSPEIFRSTYKNFNPSVISFDKEFSKEDIIKGYAFNSSVGKYRDYNEDTITVSKILTDTFFFAVYDGHGGNGCSLYLKENLHNLIKDFSKEGIIEAINKAENNFLKEKAFDENEIVQDRSGSCGIMALINKKKLIVANIGDSRLVLFKKSSIYFQTEDHKPNSPKEKARIEKGGGSIYQTQTIIPIFQNGKKIEIPWRVNPGRLSVSRTFGDIEAKTLILGGMKNVVVALPDITEIELDEEFNFLVMGCDGIFDVLTNEQILECVKIVIKEKNFDKNKNINISELCGDIADMIIKSSLALDSFDNVSCIVIAFNLEDLII